MQMSEKRLTVSDLINALQKLPPEMEIWRLGGHDEYPAKSWDFGNNTDTGLVVWRGRLYLLYDSYIENQSEVQTLFEDKPDV